ncbi:unnamed protein product, partial [Didymodactylos carnosus]
RGQSLPFEKQASLEDRYYNNKSFKEDYSVNDPEVDNAARKIQTQFRGHQTRKEIEKMKKSGQNDFDQQELGYRIDQQRQQQQDDDDDDDDESEREYYQDNQIYL